MPPKKPRTTSTENTAITPRTRGTTPFDEAKRAQGRIEKLDEQRAAVLTGLSPEAAALLDALEKLRTKGASEAAPAQPAAAAE